MKDRSSGLRITPETKVGEFLAHYPQLEELLIEMAPAFGKLRNPLLRRTVGRVATLRQAAGIGGIDLSTMINTLRKAAGQEEFVTSGESGTVEAGTRPIWMATAKIAVTLDARPLLDAGEQPVGRVLRELSRLGAGQIYELITPFAPEPLIDQARAKGFDAWCVEDTPGIYKTRFIRR